VRLPGIARGRGLAARAKLAAAALIGEPLDTTRLSLYRAEAFSAPLAAYLETLLRGPSEWSVGERELLAAFVSKRNDCTFCYRLHRAVAERTAGARVVEAAFEDYRSAPVTRELRAVLGFAAQLTERPGQVGLGDAAAVLGAGVSRAALETAIHLTAALTALNRVADALGFEIPSAAALAKHVEHVVNNGYA